jgi:hypothetical protein
MSSTSSGVGIADLNSLVAALPCEEEARFKRIFHLSATCGEIIPPASMHNWLVRYFGSTDAVGRQCIVKITNRFTLEGALFNALRAQRPLQAPPAETNVQEQLESRENCDFCHVYQGTPADVFGRVEGKHSITASNVAKFDGWHAVVVYDEHHPLHFSVDEIVDYVDTAQKWAQAAHAIDPQACYPFFLWNCLWRSGASILHGHAQMMLTRELHYGKVEHWRQAAIRYRVAHNADYFADLVNIHRALGLSIDHGAATIFPSLTPLKEKETLIIAPHLDRDLESALYRVLRTFVDQLEVQSFNVALYQPPLGHTPEDWDGFPCIFRILDRGSLQSRTSDVGAMEFFAQSVVASDPFRVADALRSSPKEEIS